MSEKFRIVRTHNPAAHVDRVEVNGELYGIGSEVTLSAADRDELAKTFVLEGVKSGDVVAPPDAAEGGEE